MSTLDILILSQDQKFTSNIKRKLGQIKRKQSTSYNIHHELNGSTHIDFAIIVDHDNYSFRVIQDVASIAKRIYVFTRKTTLNLSTIRKLFNCKVDTIAGKNQKNISILTEAVQTAITTNRLQKKAKQLVELTS